MAPLDLLGALSISTCSQPGGFHRPPAQLGSPDLVRQQIMDTHSSPPPPQPPPTNTLSSSPLTAPITLPASHQPSAPHPPLLPMATSVPSSSASTIVLTPSSPSSPCHRVHFDQTCVLIPDATEPPAIRLTAKTYAIPTWARLSRPSSYHEASTITFKLPRLVLTISLGEASPANAHSHSPVWASPSISTTTAHSVSLFTRVSDIPTHPHLAAQILREMGSAVTTTSALQSRPR
jgi:hypothetical protein